ncbi:unnamed protein product, partial [Ectocarpus sp. 12 AP-2014]
QGRCPQLASYAIRTLLISIHKPADIVRWPVRRTRPRDSGGADVNISHFHLPADPRVRVGTTHLPVGFGAAGPIRGTCVEWTLAGSVETTLARLVKTSTTMESSQDEARGSSGSSSK